MNLLPIDVDGVAWRRLAPDDTEVLQDLFERCSDHFVLHDGEPAGPDAAEIEFASLPPGRTSADKHVHGLVRVDDPRRLIGVLESVSGYPDATTWFLGLLLLDPAVRGGGLGAAMVRSFEATVAANGYDAVRLAVIHPNVAGRRFWERCGFVWQETREHRPFGGLRHDVDVLVHRLGT